MRLTEVLQSNEGRRRNNTCKPAHTAPAETAPLEFGNADPLQPTLRPARK
jgi:hypothetical protein